MSSGAGRNTPLLTCCLLVAALVLAVFGPPAAAASSLLYEQQGSGGPVVNDGAERGSVFAVPAGPRWNIEEVTLPGGPASGSFTLSFYEDDAGRPGAQIYRAPALTPDVDPSPNPGIAENLYRFTLPSALNLNPGRYWITLTGDVWWSANDPPVSGFGAAERRGDEEWFVGRPWDYNFALYGQAHVDGTPPVITPELNPATPDGDDGWYRDAVSVAWNVHDSESPISDSDGCGRTSITADTAGTELTCAATSGGGTSSSSVTVKRDATPPDVTWNGAIHHGDSFYFGAVPSKPTCAATDALAGPAGCTVGGYSAATGTHTMTATARDNAGNTSNDTRTYTVRPWTVLGFDAPVRMGSLNSVRAGATVPLKFEVLVGLTELIDTHAVKAFTQSINCATSGGEGIEQYAAGGTSLRYDTMEGRFVFNWLTPRTPGACYRVTLTTQDGSAIAAEFQLR